MGTQKPREMEEKVFLWLFMAQVVGSETKLSHSN